MMTAGVSASASASSHMAKASRSTHTTTTMNTNFKSCCSMHIHTSRRSPYQHHSPNTDIVAYMCPQTTTNRHAMRTARRQDKPSQRAWSESYSTVSVSSHHTHTRLNPVSGSVSASAAYKGKKIVGSTYRRKSGGAALRSMRYGREDHNNNKYKYKYNSNSYNHCVMMPRVRMSSAGDEQATTTTAVQSTMDDEVKELETDDNAAPSGKEEIEEEVPEQKKVNIPDGFLPILSESELPKGTRKLASLPDGSNQEVLLLWYRGEIYCIENRSPAEGAYSEGLFGARYTQTYGIVCPTTESIFSLKTGEVLEWYPNNPVLALLTPADTARPIEIFPVMIANKVIYVNAGDGSLRKKGVTYNVKTMKGGFGTSLEDNNVFGVEPVMYLEGTEPGTPVQDGEESSVFGDGLNPAVVISSTLAVAIVAVAGTATALYYESLIALAALWITLFGGVAYIVYNYLKKTGDI